MPAKKVIHKKIAKKPKKKVPGHPGPKRVAKKIAKKRGPRKVTAAHKKAMAQGRSEAVSVNRYLAVLHSPRPRGRQVTRASLQARLAQAQTRAKQSTGLDRVLAAQAVRDLQARLATSPTNNADIKTLERDFVKVAKLVSQRRGISYGAWRDAGVAADVLKRAGIARTRG